MSRALGVMAFAVLMNTAPVHAQFYKDRNVTMMINFGVGGTTDIEGRLFARHLSRHLAGNPAVVAVNRPGAGGLIGINHLGGAAKPDGLTIGFFTMDVMPPILRDPALRVSYNDFEMIAGMGQVSVAIGRKDIPPGVTRPADIAKAEEVIVGGYGPASGINVRITLLLEILNAKHRVVYGYASAGDIMKALMQNEINFMVLSMPGFQQANANIIKTGIGLPLWYLPRQLSLDGSYRKNSLFEALGIRSFSSFYQDIFGKKPSGLEWEALVFLQSLTGSLRRVVVMPPASPPSALSEMRKAFAALSEDPAFVAEYEKVIGEALEFVSAPDAQTILGQLRQAKPELVEMIKKRLEKK